MNYWKWMDKKVNTVLYKRTCDRLHESMSQASGEIYRGGQIKRWLLKSRSAGLESEI